MIEIAYAEGALQYLNELVLLIEEECFSFESTSIAYVRDIRDFIQQNIGISPKKRAPKKFAHIGADLQFITYKRNRHTTWYIFFLRKDNRYLIEHITNNHVVAKYLKR